MQTRAFIRENGIKRYITKNKPVFGDFMLRGGSIEYRTAGFSVGVFIWKYIFHLFRYTRRRYAILLFLQQSKYSYRIH